jgi:hypothetical protein
MSSRVPAQQSGHPALSQLVGGTTDTFAQVHWGVEPLLSRAADLPAPFSDLLDEAAVDELISQRALRTPFLRVARNGTTLADRLFTAGGGTGATIADQVSDDKLLRLFADGATLVLQGLHRSWAPLMAFSQQLAADLGHPVQANAYVTPPQNTGFSDHYDVHDVFVLQVHGEKRWRIREPVRRSPLRDEVWTDRRDAVQQAALGAPLLEVTLSPGDCLYLPRGYLHAATALGGVSTHVTLGVHSWTGHHLAEDLATAAVRRATEDEAVRACLPVGFELTAGGLAAHVEVVREAVKTAIDQISAEDLARLLAARAKRTQRAAPVGVLAQARAADSLGEEQQVRLRPYLWAELVLSADGSACLDSRAGAVPLDAPDVPAVEQLLVDGAAQVGQLGQPLARRLLLAGIVVPA